eukprot:2720244-Pleurochrysis_carterae.AAC.1
MVGNTAVVATPLPPRSRGLHPARELRLAIPSSCLAPAGGTGGWRVGEAVTPGMLASDAIVMRSLRGKKGRRHMAAGADTRRMR